MTFSPWLPRVRARTATLRPAPPLWLVAALAGAALVLAGCNTNQDPTTTPTSTPTPTATPASGDAVPNLATLPSIADLVERVQPAVVSIVVRDTVRTAFGTRNTFGSGSGVIFREDGYILTNNHVIEDADSIEVTLFDGRDLQAEIVGADPITDLAVIKVDERDMSTVPLGDVSRLRVGDWVVAIGNAAGLVGRPSVTLGVVSAFERTITAAGVMLRDLIQTDALINPGNSGGPLLNLSGEVIGINTAVLREDGIEGIGFAVGAETATLVADQLVSNGRVIWPWLGIGAANVDRLSAAEMNLSVRDGVLVTQLVPGGPADRAGLRVEDVVIAIDDVPTPDVTTLQRLRRREFKVGQSVTVTLVRGSEETEVHLTLAEQPR